MSKELKALEDIILYLNANEPKGLYCKNIEIIKTALKEYEGAKQHIEALHKERVENSLKLKTLEIIKNKRVNIHQFVSSNNLKLIDYNYLQNKERELTQEEYDLLKEVLL